MPSGEHTLCVVGFVTVAADSIWVRAFLKRTHSTQRKHTEKTHRETVAHVTAHPLRQVFMYVVLCYLIIPMHYSKHFHTYACYRAID